MDRAGGTEEQGTKDLTYSTDDSGRITAAAINACFISNLLQCLTALRKLLCMNMYTNV